MILFCSEGIFNAEAVTKPDHRFVNCANCKFDPRIFIGLMHAWCDNIMQLCLLVRMSDDTRDHKPPTKSHVLTDHGVYMTICQIPEIWMHVQNF